MLKRVKVLEDRLDRVEADEVPIPPKRGKRSAATITELQRELQHLQKKVSRLEQVRIFLQTLVASLCLFLVK